MSAAGPPPRRTRAELRRHNREALLDAAARVFAARGFRVATIDEVATAAGLTKGAVYSHFDDKHDLFAAAIERRYQERLDAFRALLGADGDPGERAARAALEFARSVTADADWALLFVEAWAEMLRTPAFGQRVRAIDEQVRAALAEVLRVQLAAVAPGSDVTPGRLAEMVMAMTHGFGVEHRLDPERAPASLFAEMMAIFAAGVASGARALDAEGGGG